MKKITAAFKQARRDNKSFSRHDLKNASLPFKIAFIITAIIIFLILAISYRAVSAQAPRTEIYLKLNFSGDTIRTRYFEDSERDFADELLQEELNALNEGEPLTLHAQILIFLDDNAVMNYAQDDPQQIIELAEVIAQQWERELEKDLPDLLTFTIFDEALAITYKGQLWTSKDYFIQAQFAIDRQAAIWEEEKTNENMYSDREEEQMIAENLAIRRDQELQAIQDYHLNQERDQAERALDRLQNDTGEGFFEITNEHYIFLTDGLNTLVYPKPELW